MNVSGILTWFVFGVGEWVEPKINDKVRAKKCAWSWSCYIMVEPKTNDY